MFDEYVGFKAPPDELPSGFTTASGSTINLSQKALSKAKKLLAIELEESDDCKETCNVENRTDTSVSRMDYQSSDNNKNDLLLSGFTTASGNTINLSQRALSKAKKLFAQEFEETNDYEETCNNKNKIDVSEIHMDFESSDINNKNDSFLSGFTTANGNMINLSQTALMKAKKLLAKELEETDDCKETCNIKNNTDTSEARTNCQTSDIDNKSDGLFPGFSTASGAVINVSQKALLKAKKLLAEELNESDHEETWKTENEMNVHKMQIENVHFQTSRSQHNNTEFPIKETLYQEKVPVESESTPALFKPIQKRKIKDLDDNLLNKRTKSNQFKKLRFSNEFRDSSCIHKNSASIEKGKTPSISSMPTQHGTNKLDSGTDKIETIKGTEIIDNCFISHEIATSAVAILADENNLDFTEQWTSPTVVKQDEEAEDLPSSPVIGQFIPKKRKGTRSRKKVYDKENTCASTNNLLELNDNCASSKQCINKENENLMKNEEKSNSLDINEFTDTNEFSDSQLMLDFINQSVTILEKRLEAALEQDKQISLKQRNKPKPTISKLHFHKKSNAKNRVSWKQISKGKKPIPRTYEELIERKLPPEILDITADNAVAYKFRCADFYGQDIVQNNIDGLKLEDGGRLILDENSYAGITEIKRCFLASPGVDPKLVPTRWVENHYKWIVWKLASIDRIKLGSVNLPRALTPDRVMMELKYRYEREIDRFQRPALRRILEKDDTSTKRMVLCVASIKECNDSISEDETDQLKTPSKRLILTDGWYSVQASVDQALIKHIISGKVKEGTKLLTYGCELLNCDQGYSPLEVPENVCLKLHTNSTRRARWDTKMGYIVPSGPMCIKLKTIYPHGGLIGKIKVTIARVYPMLYHEKTSSGESIFRNLKCEEKVNIAYEKERCSLIEAFYAKAEKYFYSGKNATDSNADGFDLAAIEYNEDYERLSKEEFRSQREFEQLRSNCRMKEERFRQQLESQLQQSLPPPRQVTPVLKIRVVEEEITAVLSIWSPSEEVLDILKEGNHISISNVMPSMKRGNELQLTAGRNAMFSQINSVSKTNSPRRTYTALCDISKPTFAPAYGEFDTVGVVVSIGNEPYGMKNFEAVHLAYRDANSQSFYLSILFWQGISSYGYAEICNVGSFIACNNLEWRRATSWNIPISYCTERSSFTRNPRQNYLQQPLEELKRSITDINAYISTCREEIVGEVQKKSVSRKSDQYTPDKHNINKMVQNENSNAFEGSLGTNNGSVRSAAIKKRIEKLQCYGEPSSLSPIILNNSSKRVSLEFQSPLRSTKPRTSLNTKFAHNSR
ncbi:breast cancer type 2 susceptibility protein homolog [Xylocopa sonorina]|uniref:breast cancer type 2 susceptibility protein homolog n=1 Tax=Xylocopa sonorina TaxID=1818115 RepID=UPI00403AECB8